jgi:hypothetical protein
MSEKPKRMTTKKEVCDQVYHQLCGKGLTLDEAHWFTWFGVRQFLSDCIAHHRAAPSPDEVTRIFYSHLKQAMRSGGIKT